MNSFYIRLSKYAFSYLNFFFSRLRKIFGVGRKCDDDFDLVFVVRDRGWILEALCREIAKRYKKKFCFHYDLEYLPRAKNYFFSHYSYLPLSLINNPYMWGRKNFVLYTHPSNYDGVTDKEFIFFFNRITKVICICSQNMKVLISQGVDPSRLSFILGAADPELFKPHERLEGAVLFCSRYYPRKEPSRIIGIAKKMPHRRFILLGKRWEQSPHFSEMLAAPNFSYFDVPYSDYPKYYGQADVFVSPSKLEGGPIPLIEAMMCNIVPVANNGGFATDIIINGENGFIFDKDSPVEEICELIDQAYTLKTDIRETVKDLTWENFSNRIIAILEAE